MRESHAIAAVRLEEICAAYWAGAYREDEVPATFDEVMNLLEVFRRDHA